MSYERALVLAAVVAGSTTSACSGTGDDDFVPPPIDTCLVTMNPAGVSLELSIAETPAGGVLDVDADCVVRSVRTAGSETRIVLDTCMGTTDTATIAVASLPALEVQLSAGETVHFAYELRTPDSERRRLVVARADGSPAIAALTGSSIPDDAFFGPLTLGSEATECDPVPQGCFAAEKRAVTVSFDATTVRVPTRHVGDEGRLHVRVEQADILGNQMGCTSLPPAWYDFLVAVDPL